ncbi:MAG: hypothetical protein QXW32_06485 [Nitrososphaerales archaeon]
MKKLKVELGCKTWAELLAKLVASEKTTISTKDKLDAVKSVI